MTGPAVSYFWVALGGALGSCARYAAGQLVARFSGSAFPWSTLLVNVSGSLLIGILAGLVSADGKPWLSADARAFLMVGMLGGFTTFSSFSLETLNLARNGDWLGAGANVAASVGLCLVTVWVGFGMASGLSR